jgi:urease accessory protein
MSVPRRISTIRPSGNWPVGDAIDRVVLNADDRQRRRIVLIGEKGTTLLLDFEKPVTLRDGDGLVLDDGSIVAVAGEAEQLIAVSAKAPLDFVRLAWHIGNRHTDIQFVDRSFRIRRDHVLEDMLKGLGAVTAPVDAPFDPEPAAPHGGGHHHHD